MKCFVASAFGRNDVDAIFDRCIKPVLSPLRIKPLRVDRHEHNDDIDDTIMRLMRESDFGIVDLTYARPSAYFEAGHLLGSGKPVIFIARQDHFKDKDGDPEGTRVIHFDLKMKNVISWNAASEAFRRKLRRRITVIVRPLISEKKRKAEQTNETQEFARLSHSAQSIAITGAAERILKQHAFSPEKPDYPSRTSVKRWIRSNKRRRTILILMNQLKFLKADIPYLNYYTIPMVTKEEAERLTNIDVVFVMSSVNSISKSSFRNYFQSHDLLPDGSLHRSSYETSEYKASPTSTRICFIEKIVSISDFKTRFDKITSAL